MFDCTITGLVQELSFEKNVTTTYVLIRLRNGRVVKAAVDEAAASAIVEMQVEDKGAPSASSVEAPSNDADSYSYPEEPTPTSDEVVEVEDNAVRVFGGGIEAIEADAPAPVEEEEEEPPPVVEAVRTRGKPRTQRRAPYRTVSADGKGYPITAGIDSEELSSSKNRDEDGVGSI